MTKVFVALLIFVGALASATSAQSNADRPDDSQTATVRIVAIREDRIDFGLDLTVGAFVAQGRDFSSHFRHAKGSGIPFGTYRASVCVPDFWGCPLGSVEVSQSDVMVVIDLRALPQGATRASSNF